MDSLIQKIIVPVDFSPVSEGAARFGCALARNLGAHVYLIHVLEATAPGSTHLTDTSGLDQRRYTDAKNAMTSFVRRVDPAASVTTEIRPGAVDEAVAGAVVAYGGDLVVMATHARSGLPHLLFGSIAEKVVRKVRLPRPRDARVRTGPGASGRGPSARSRAGRPDGVGRPQF